MAMKIYFQMTANGAMSRDTKPLHTTRDSYVECFIENDAISGMKNPRLRHSQVTKFSTVFVECTIFEYACSDCKIPPEYCGKPLTLNLDHINGDLKDDRLANLRLLCPNCRSQQPTKRMGRDTIPPCK